MENDDSSSGIMIMKQILKEIVDQTDDIERLDLAYRILKLNEEGRAD